MVRRLKEDVREMQGGFPQRNVVPVVVDDLPEDAPELLLSRLLDDYRTVRERRLASGSARAQAAAGLLLVGLQQRLLSSVEAFARSLAVHRRAVERHWTQESGETAPAPPRPDGTDARLFTKAPGADDERASWTAEDVETDEKRQVEAVTAAAEEDPSRGADAALRERERELLDRMQAIAEQARGRPDAKTRRLIDWIREHLCADLPPFGRAPDPSVAPPRWNDRRVLIFTENLSLIHI